LIIGSILIKKKWVSCPANNTCHLLSGDGSMEE